MPCYSPLKGFRGKKNKNGKFPIVFSRDAANSRLPVVQTLPCGQCIGCRLEYSRQWAIRCMHEASLHAENSFLTLTYRPKDLPKDHCLHLRDFQLFMKRLRKKFGNGIRFFHSGEYGDKRGRPHYHAIIFGHNFEDRKYFKTLPSGCDIYISKELDALWGKGYASIGEVTFESCAYVARYVVKKMNGKNSDEHYKYVHPDSGEIIVRPKEYSTMSRRPGLSSDWFDLYWSDVYPCDNVVMRDIKMLPPKFYDTLYERRFGEEAMAVIKAKRRVDMQKYADDSVYERLVVREIIAQRKVTELLRELESAQDE